MALTWLPHPARGELESERFEPSVAVTSSAGNFVPKLDFIRYY